MRILDLLKENFNLDLDDDGDTAGVTGFTAPKISVSDLNSLQLRTLNRLRDGIIDMESASDKEMDIIIDLIEIGLVDADGNVTDAGQEAGEEPSTNVKLDTEVDVGDVGGDDSFDFEDDGEDEISFDLGRKRQDY